MDIRKKIQVYSLDVTMCSRNCGFPAKYRILHSNNSTEYLCPTCYNGYKSRMEGNDQYVLDEHIVEYVKEDLFGVKSTPVPMGRPAFDKAIDSKKVRDSLLEWASDL